MPEPDDEPLFNLIDQKARDAASKARFEARAAAALDPPPNGEPGPRADYHLVAEKPRRGLKGAK
jgi:hypothetical protein